MCTNIYIYSIYICVSAIIILFAKLADPQLCLEGD